MSEELKPCPFCGSKAEFDPLSLGVSVYCPNEECPTTPETGYCDTQEAAVAAWNRRSESIIQEDLSMLIRMMVTKHRRGKLDEEYCEKALDYLQRKGLQGSLLRAL